LGGGSEEVASAKVKEFSKAKTRREHNLTAQWWKGNTLRRNGSNLNHINFSETHLIGGEWGKTERCSELYGWGKGGSSLRSAERG